ncbi:MAG: hypothetical protein N2235_02910 [Fischerella sp.]|nr:hypothetical protein [Fischerella sp.]
MQSPPKQPKPRKQRQPKSKRLNVSIKARWQKILKDVETKEIPISVMQSLSVNLIDGTVIDINIKDLLLEGIDPEEIEAYLENKLKELDSIIKDVDFFIDVEAVAKTVQPITDLTLKNL